VIGAPPLRIDEPPPLGEERGPDAAALLGAAVGDCVAASLVFCLRKARVNQDFHAPTHADPPELQQVAAETGSQKVSDCVIVL
jgi:hypothetical protein